MKIKEAIIPFAFALYIPLCGWAIYRGTVYTADLRLPGLQTDRTALVFNPALKGNYNFAALNVNNLSFNYPYILNTIKFPSPEQALNFVSADVVAWVDIPLYAPRCLQLAGSIEPPVPFLRFAETVMRPNGVGVRGDICQLEFNDPAAFTVMDPNLCGYTLFTCMHGFFFVGCVNPVNYPVTNCVRCHAGKQNCHYNNKLLAVWAPNTDLNTPGCTLFIPTTTSTTTTLTTTTTTTTTTITTTTITATTTTTDTTTTFATTTWPTEPKCYLFEGDSCIPNTWNFCCDDMLCCPNSKCGGGISTPCETL